MTLDEVSIKYKQATRLLYDYSPQKDPYQRDPDAFVIGEEVLVKVYEEIMKDSVTPRTPIRVIQEFPKGWHTVAAAKFVLVLTYYTDIYRDYERKR